MNENAYLRYAEENAKDFFEYLHEVLICTDTPEVTQALKLVLNDYAVTWADLDGILEAIDAEADFFP